MSFKPKNFAVWTEIPVLDLDQAISFYSNVFNIELAREDTGPNPMAMFPTDDDNSVAGHLYPGKPATDGQGPTIHFACPDTLEATRDRLAANGGTVLSDPIAIPPGSFFYARDPDGNSISVFKPADGNS